MCVATVTPIGLPNMDKTPPGLMIVYATDHGPYGGSAAESFKRVELVLAVSLLFDILTRLLTSHDIPRFLRSYYTLMDLAAFVAIAYFGVFIYEIKIYKYSNFDCILATGPFRMLRVRSVLKSLDSAIEQQAGHRRIAVSFGPVQLTFKV